MWVNAFDAWNLLSQVFWLLSCIIPCKFLHLPILTLSLLIEIMPPCFVLRCTLYLYNSDKDFFGGLQWVFVAVRAFSGCGEWELISVAVRGLLTWWPLLLGSTGSGHGCSVAVAHRLSCPVACGIFLDQGSSLCPLHWQADSYPLYHHSSPRQGFLNCI